jgi:hypothetical protein
VPDEQDFFADWNMVFAEEPPPPAHAAVTEAIPLPQPAVEAGASETAVLPQVPASRPLPMYPERPSRPAPQGFPLGASVALLGAVAVVVSAILPWAGDGQGLPRDIPARVLIDPTGPVSGINLGVVLLVAGTIGALAALLTMVVPWLGVLRRLVGLATLAVPALFLFRAWEPLAGGLGAFPDLLEPGVVAAAAGGLVQIVAGKWFRR